jgi:hypothetical protein
VCGGVWWCVVVCGVSGVSGGVWCVGWCVVCESKSGHGLACLLGGRGEEKRLAGVLGDVILIPPL